MRFKGQIRILSWALAAFLITGCGSEEGTPTPEPVAQAPTPKNDKASEAAADVAGSLEEEYVYNPISKRDPFRTFIASQEAEEIRSPTPLQKYEIDQYKLTGIIWGIERPRALVEDPEAVGHVVEIGTYIGRNWGKVTQISSSEVVITEEYMTPDGSLVTNPVLMSLVANAEESK